MCAITNANTLAALQVAVLHRVKIDYPVCSINTKMEGIINQITQFVNDTDNHTTIALDEFKKFELFIATQRRCLTTNIATANKQAIADERRAELNHKAELKLREKEEAAALRKRLADHKKSKKTALLKLSKMLKKPKSPIAGKTDAEVQKWAMIGAKSNYAPVKKAARDAARTAKKIQKEHDDTARKLANAGKPKNGDYARFCKWFTCDADDIKIAGCANKRDYNKQVWVDGIELAWGSWTDDDCSWDDFKKSSAAPWNAAK
jgi:hypothetical protein